MNLNIIKILFLAGLNQLVFCKESVWTQKVERAITHQNNGQCTHAIKIYKEVILVKPHWYSLYNRIGECFQKLGYEEIAVKYFRKTLTYDPSNSKAESVLKKYMKDQQESDQQFEISLPSKSKFMTTSEIKALNKRLWFLRNGLLNTSLRDGRDLREYSTISMLEVFPERGGNGGFPVLMNAKEGDPHGIFYLYPDEGAMTRISGENYDCRQPLLLQKENELLFLAKYVKKSVRADSSQNTTEISSEGFGLYGLNLNEQSFDKKPDRYLPEFYSIKELYIDLMGSVYFVGKKFKEARNEIYRWKKNTDPEKITIGLGDISTMQLSPDNKKIMAFVGHADTTYSVMVIDLGNKHSFAVIPSRHKRLAGTWSRDSKHYFIAATDEGKKDRWETRLYQVNILNSQVIQLLESNFLYKDLIVDEQSQNLYYLSNFDGNYEVYSFNLEAKSQQRLTISISDETQLGFWTFSGI